MAIIIACFCLYLQYDYAAEIPDAARVIKTHNNMEDQNCYFYYQSIKIPCTIISPLRDGNLILMQCLTDNKKNKYNRL